MNSRVVKKKVRIDLYEVFALKGDIAMQLALNEKGRELFQEVLNDIPENAVPFIEGKMYRPTGLEMIFEITVGWREKDNSSKKLNDWRKDERNPERERL